MKSHFPIFKNRPNLTYLDSGASAQKPECVLNAIKDFAENGYANIHRGYYALSLNATQKYEEARETVAHFFGVTPAEIVFTKNGTEAANLFVSAWGKYLTTGDEVLLPLSEHHANFVPWLRLREERGIVLKFVEPDQHGVFTLNDFTKQISIKTKAIAVAQVSNVTGQIFPIAQLAELAHQNGSIIFVDICQSAPHFAIDLKKMGVDAAFFTGHKLGAGATGGLFAKMEILETLSPLLVGGDSIIEVTTEGYTLLPPPERFESGTPALENIVGLSTAIQFLQEHQREEKLRKHEIHLLSLLQTGLQKIPDIHIIGPQNIQERSGLISFYHENIHHSDISMYLAEHDICVRSGFHCANPLHQFLGIPGTVRASVWMYNTEEDIEKFLQELGNAISLFAK
ncbi:MAG: cysteine desulfurase [Candidatus Peregrinibacteria bacterium]